MYPRNQLKITIYIRIKQFQKNCFWLFQNTLKMSWLIKQVKFLFFIKTAFNTNYNLIELFFVFSSLWFYNFHFFYLLKPYFIMRVKFQSFQKIFKKLKAYIQEIWKKQMLLVPEQIGGLPKDLFIFFFCQPL